MIKETCRCVLERFLSRWRNESESEDGKGDMQMHARKVLVEI